jgi:hypothetical protein
MTATWTWIKLLFLSFCNWANHRSFVRFGAVEGTISCCSAEYCTGYTVTPAPFLERFYYCHQIDLVIFVTTLPATNHKRNMAGLGDGRFRLTKDGKVYTKGKKYAQCGSIRDTYGS